MAIAQKGDPLKKQKDTLNFKNKAVDKFWKPALTEAVAGIPAMAVVKPVLEKAGFRKVVRESAAKEAVGGTIMSTPITNRLTSQNPSNGKHPRKVKTREKVTRRGRTKTTKTKY